MERKYRQSLNAYDYQPEEMKAYLRHNGWHFNKKMCEWAIKQMRKNGKPIRIMSKDDIDEILKKNNIVLENNVGYDAVYIAHMCLADFTVRLSRMRKRWLSSSKTTWTMRISKTVSSSTASMQIHHSTVLAFLGRRYCSL